MKIACKVASLSLALLMLGGCATSRSELDIAAPTSTQTIQTNGKSVYINSVTDKRIFEVAPSSPNIPSLDPGADQSDKVKVRAIGRKRNGFGQALGDILLKEGQTIESLTNTSIRQAFLEKGYKVIDRNDMTTKDTYVVDANIDKFWSWMNPGFASITLSTEISTELTIKSPEGTNRQTVSVKAADGFQTGMEENWVAVIKTALRGYVDDLKSKLK